MRFKVKRVAWNTSRHGQIDSARNFMLPFFKRTIGSKKRRTWSKSKEYYAK